MAEQGRVEYRPARVDDAAAISQLICRYARDFTASSDGTGAEQFLASVSEAAEAEYISNRRYHFIVACSGNRLAGFIAVRDRNHLFHLFVEPGFQRQGIATHLWREARAAACNAGAYTVNSSLPALPVYERFGFVPAGPEVVAHGICFLPMRLAADQEHG